ncbi:MAG: Crp/Fnr family transcriptional regulator [Peptococcaceae bacterium]
MDAKTKELVEHITTSIIFDRTTLESEGLSSIIWEKYLDLCTCKKFKKAGDYLHRIGDNLNGCYFIGKGRIKSNFLGKDGAIKTFSITGEGCSFGEQFVFHSQPGLYETIVVEDAELYFFDKETFLEIIRKDFEVNLFIVKSLSIKSRMLAIQLEDMCLRNVLQNICRILYSICCYEEKNGKIEGDLAIFLSHEDLANMLGSHRVTVTKNLNNLKKQGVLNYKYEKIIIKDRQKIKKLAFL